MYTQDEILDNVDKLKDFIKSFDLTDRNSNIIFMANVIYDTSKNSKPFNSKVRISLNGYRIQGDVSIEEPSIDSHLYPVILKVEYQKFEFIEHQYLLVKGNHSQNPNIGNYSVKIYPLK